MSAPASVARPLRKATAPGRRLAHKLGLGRYVTAWRLRRHRARLAGPKLLRAFAHAFPKAVFVEIGANDGEHHDHLRPIILRCPWQGIMVEPVPEVFARLRTNYSHLSQVTLENVAIADSDGSLPFYRVAPASGADGRELPYWVDGIGSFSREVVASHARLVPDIESQIVQTHVPCLTFSALCAKHSLESVDLVLLDTEGYDYQILRTIDFSAYRPALVIYEHYHLATSERIASRDYMHQAGYETLVEGFDTWCLRTGADRRLTANWRRLTPGLPEYAAEDEPL
jgi:FkbM family methyltransferase